MKKNRHSIKFKTSQPLPTMIDPNELELLVASLRLGKDFIDKEDIDRIYMSHVRLIIAIAGEYVYRAKHLIDDLVSVGLLEMAKAINDAPRVMKNNNITPYITIRVRGAISDACSSNHLMPASTVYHLLSIDPNAKIPIYQPLILPTDRDYDFEDMVYRQRRLRNKPKCVMTPNVINHEICLDEIWDDIETIIEQDENLKRREFKKVVVRLKASGYTNEEIAGIIEISESQVQKLLHQVKDKYVKLEKDY